MSQAYQISDAEKTEWNSLSTPALAARFGWSDQYKALQSESSQRRAPQRLLTRAIGGYIEQVVSIRTLAMLRRCDVAVIEAELREAGIVLNEVEVAWADAAQLPELDLDLTELEEIGEADSG